MVPEAFVPLMVCTWCVTFSSHTDHLHMTWIKYINTHLFLYFLGFLPVFIFLFFSFFFTYLSNTRNIYIGNRNRLMIYNHRGLYTDSFRKVWSFHHKNDPCIRIDICIQNHYCPSKDIHRKRNNPNHNRSANKTSLYMWLIRFSMHVKYARTK